ncbi:unnamed protein product [Clavelina lepadiformis]|uniref:NADH dehydrogenase [ubiquinone] 1 beta subcomplex subunit 7 n=1 Tax=Clavelina lepadiformis TaxID=159417 RepID=A0ABP0GBX4_CLALP
MGPGISRYSDINAEPLQNKQIYEKFEDHTRPVREMKVTSEEMDRARVPRERRDYCAHLWLGYLKCKREWFPELSRCDGVLHDYKHCNVDDIKHNMMEYERTKRLMARERKAMAESMAED